VTAVAWDRSVTQMTSLIGLPMRFSIIGDLLEAFIFLFSFDSYSTLLIWLEKPHAIRSQKLVALVFRTSSELSEKQSPP
jgi:hypothetical protein